MMRAPRPRLASDHYLVPGYRDIEAYPEQIALMMAPMLTLDGHTAGHDLVEEPVELRGMFAYPVLDAGWGPQPVGR